MAILMRRSAGWAMLAAVGLLVLASCGTAPSAPAAAAPTVAVLAPTAQPGDQLYIYTGAKGDAERLTIVDSVSGARQRDLPPGVAAPDWSTLYVVEQVSGQTRVRALDVASGRALRETCSTACTGCR